MARPKYVFKFPPELTDTPFAERLVSEFGLGINILRARVEPDEEGVLVMELTGKPDSVSAALECARSLGVEVRPLATKIHWHPDRCVQCTACRSVCRTGALFVTRPGMTVAFDPEKCVACKLCISACPYKAVEIAIED